LHRVRLPSWMSCQFLFVHNFKVSLTPYIFTMSLTQISCSCILAVPRRSDLLQYLCRFDIVSIRLRIPVHIINVTTINIHTTYDSHNRNLKMICCQRLLFLTVRKLAHFLARLHSSPMHSSVWTHSHQYLHNTYRTRTATCIFWFRSFFFDFFIILSVIISNQFAVLLIAKNSNRLLNIQLFSISIQLTFTHK